MYSIIPWYVTPIVLIVAATLTFWLYRLVSRAAIIADIAPTARARVRQGTGVFLATWLGLAFVLAPTTPVWATSPCPLDGVISR